MTSPAPILNDVLRRALAGIDHDDVRIFYEYFEEMKAHVRGYLCRKAKRYPGASAVAQSALFSLFRHPNPADEPLEEIDEEGCPAHWPLLLRYLERHCNKWNHYYQARKRKGTEVPLDELDISLPPRDEEGDDRVDCALEALMAHGTERQQQVAELLMRGWTQAEIARELRCSEATISEDKKKIIKLLETV